MSLIVTIFMLVFLTELVSWIGKSVLLELVRRPTFHMFRGSVLNAFAGLGPLL